MNGAVPLAHFDRGKPFYPLVMQYAMQLVGFKELAVRGAVGGRDVKQAVNKVTGLSDEQSADAANLAANLEKLLGPLELRSSVRVQPLLVPVDDIAKEVVSNVWFLGNYLLLSAGSVLILRMSCVRTRPPMTRGLCGSFFAIAGMQRRTGVGSTSNTASHDGLPSGGLLRSLQVFKEVHCSRAQTESAFYLQPIRSCSFWTSSKRTQHWPNQALHLTGAARWFS